MEMHLVHKSADGRIIVVGVLIEEGSDNAAFDKVWNYLPTAENRGERPVNRMVQFTVAFAC